MNVPKKADDDFLVVKNSPSDKIIALAGNPNVGKSTVFNALTGMNQHTGNWPGKTVANAQGEYKFKGKGYILVDLPGTYSINPHSAEEEIARDFILFGGADATVIVCDATCLERNLNLVLQVIELTPKVVVCVNLLDEAEKKGIQIDLAALERELGVPVAGSSARSGKGLDTLMERVEEVCADAAKIFPRRVRYNKAVEESVAPLAEMLDKKLLGGMNGRWLALRMLEQDKALEEKVKNRFGSYVLEDTPVVQAVTDALATLEKDGIESERLTDVIVSGIVLSAEEVALEVCEPAGGCGLCLGCAKTSADSRDRRLDKILTSKRTGIPIMLALLCGILWLTITGANYPSQILADVLFRLQDMLTALFTRMNAPEWLHGMLVLGMYRVLAWVVSVMLPPMALFFPIFTLLEDFGYLPRVAFNLDHSFKKAKTCGKQALTMCMGFGCNAVGVTGCRIIDSPRERLIAIITNNFVPCNGRFPTLIAIISMFFVGAAGGLFASALSALILTGVIMFGVLLTFWVSRFLSETVLKGEPSSFTLELPPYRTPQFGKVIVRSVFDRTLFVLGRAAAVAAPAGMVIWLLANVSVDGASLLAHCSAFLDPFGRALGMDGVILLAFILGFPANETVVPIIIMAYMSAGSIMGLDSLTELKTLLTANGWTWVTAVCTMLFCLVHWPCSTTCITIKKETGSLKWTLISIAIPTAIGMAVCFAVATAARMFGIG